MGYLPECVSGENCKRRRREAAIAEGKKPLMIRGLGSVVIKINCFYIITLLHFLNALVWGPRSPRSVTGHSI